jgi:DMSO reductase family type II enzyme chaperone
MAPASAAPTTAPASLLALGRSLVYRTLVVAFHYPETLDPGPFTGAASRLTATAETLPRAVVDALGALAAAMQETTLDRWREAHVATFGHVTLADCPLHETACTATDPFQQTQALADLAGFYRAFGLEVGGETGERADHLAIELEFMHYLAYREAWAREHHGTAQVALIRDAQRRFLEHHLGRWAPAVARAVTTRGEEPLRTAAELLARFLEDEHTRWGIDPASPASPPAPGDDAAEGGDGPREDAP